MQIRRGEGVKIWLFELKHLQEPIISRSFGRRFASSVMLACWGMIQRVNQDLTITVANLKKSPFGFRRGKAGRAGKIVGQNDGSCSFCAHEARVVFGDGRVYLRPKAMLKQ